MNEKRIVSIIVPTFNRLGRLRTCIDKIRQHVGSPHEVLVVAGCSTDGTRERLTRQPDLSLKVQINEGLKVIGCRRPLIHHEEYHDERKGSDLTIGEEDNAKLFAKWNLPEKNSYPDPDPAYRRMLAERELI